MFGTDLTNDPTHILATNKFDLSDMRRRYQSLGDCSSFLPTTLDLIEDTGRTTGLGKCFDDSVVGSWAKFGGFEDDTTTGSNGVRNCAGGENNSAVPTKRFLRQVSNMR